MNNETYTQQSHGNTATWTHSSAVDELKEKKKRDRMCWGRPGFYSRQGDVGYLAS